MDGTTMSNSPLQYSIKVVWDQNIDLSTPRAAKLLQRANKAAGMAILEDASRRFQNEGSPPEKWKPLSPITIQRRRQGKNNAGNANLPVARILQDTGTLAKSMLEGSKDNHFDANSTRVIVGTKVKYAAPHQFGYRHIPQRQFFYSPEDLPPLRKDIQEIYETICREFINGSGTP